MTPNKAVQFSLPTSKDTGRYGRCIIALKPDRRAENLCVCEIGGLVVFVKLLNLFYIIK